MLTLFRSEHCYPYEVNEKKKNEANEKSSLGVVFP